MRSAALSLVALLLLSAAPPSESSSVPAAAAATTQVVMVSAEYADVPEFDVTGPTEVKAGASFILKADVPKGVNANAVRWVIDPAPPAFDFDRSFDGRYKLTVLDPPAGRYVTTLVGATLVDGEPVPLLTVRTVTVGDGKPDPVDPDVPPKPVPGPDLTGVAKAAYDAAPKGRPAEAQTVAGIYRGVASAGAAVSTMTPAEMSAKLNADMRAAMTAEQRAFWKPFAEVTGPYLDKARTREATIETLNEIADGVEAVQ